MVSKMKWRIAIPWTNREDTQGYVDSFHKQGVKVTGYGTLTGTANDGETLTFVVFDLISSIAYYNTIKETLPNYEEYLFKELKLLAPKGAA